MDGMRGAGGDIRLEDLLGHAFHRGGVGLLVEVAHLQARASEGGWGRGGGKGRGARRGEGGGEQEGAGGSRRTGLSLGGQTR